MTANLPGVVTDIASVKPVQVWRIPDENLYRDKIILNIALHKEEWMLRYVESDDHWGENRGSELSRDDTGHYVPLETRRAFTRGCISMWRRGNESWKSCLTAVVW